MPSSGGFNTVVDFVGDDGAEGLRVGSVTQTPDIFNFLLRKVQCLGDVNVG